MRQVTAVIVVIVATLASSVVIAADTPKPPYLLLYAFDEEGREVAAKMTVDTSETILGRIVLSGTVSGKPVRLAESGIGMTNAAMTTQRLIDKFRPCAVIFTGIAGAIDSTVQVGDIVAASSWTQHDYGYLGANDFELNGIRTFAAKRDSVIRMTEFAVDSNLIAIAGALNEESLSLALIGARRPKVIIGGIGASGNSFVDSRDKRAWLLQQLKAKVVDMESAAVAQVCTANGVPFIVFRSASDLAGGSGSSTAQAELDRFFKVAAKNSASVMLDMLQRLPVCSEPNQ